ncbi:MAG TPA: LysE family translocator [Casimicrobiaceae bacterium]|nr:LysE family translocator [Casimicrobiaceae bacterium]
MLTLETWLVFCVACVALAATPGPNMLFLVSRTLAQGRAAGFVSLAGTSTGFALHAVAAALGLTALLAAVPVAFEIVRVAGALYLAWLAIATWRASDEADPRVTAPRVANLAMYRQGLLTSLLNPKLAVFQLALFPQFVDPARGSVLTQGLVLAVTQLVIVIAGDSACVFAATGARRWFAARPGFSRWSKRALAGVFAALAARLAVQSRA